MKTVKEVSRLTGVSVRTLHHYDAIGLLKPTATTASGYRLYDDRALERLQSILLFRQLQFPLKEIRNILDSPDYDRDRALEQQIRLLELQKEHIQQLLDLARDIRSTGVSKLNFTAFDTTKMDEYAAQAKAVWGETAAYRECAEKSGDRSREEEIEMGAALMEVFRAMGAVQSKGPESPEAQALVERLRETITKNYYTCTPEILSSLGEMYAGGGSMTENIDWAGGAGTAAFARKAIACYVKNL